MVSLFLYVTWQDLARGDIVKVIDLHLYFYLRLESYHIFLLQNLTWFIFLLRKYT